MAVIWKGMTVKQPYADLLAIGAKQYETRTKPTKYRGPIVIHAGKATDQMNFIFTETEYTSDSLRKKREAMNALLDPVFMMMKDRPAYGAIIGYADLVGCYAVADIKNLTETERLFGDWSEGRYAWEIAHVRMVEPIPHKGQLGLWNVPYEIIQQLNTIEADQS